MLAAKIALTMLMVASLLGIALIQAAGSGTMESIALDHLEQGLVAVAR